MWKQANVKVFDSYEYYGSMKWVVLRSGVVKTSMLDITKRPTIFFTPPMRIGIVDFYHSTPLSMTLTLPGDHKISAKQNLSSLHFLTLFSWKGWNLIWCWSNLSWISKTFLWDLLKQLLFYWVRQKTYVGMHSVICESIRFKLGMMTDTIALYILILLLLIWSLIQDHRRPRKQKNCFWFCRGFFHMNNILNLMHLARIVHLSLVAKALTLDIAQKTFQFKSFMPAIHIGIINFYDFFYNFRGLELGWKSQTQQKAKPNGHISLTLNWSGWNLVWYCSNLSWMPWYHLRAIHWLWLKTLTLACTQWFMNRCCSSLVQ